MEFENEFKNNLEEVDCDHEKIMCRRVDLIKEYGDLLNKADSYIKTATIKARQATTRELIKTDQDGAENYAEVGDWIIQNPGDEDPYVYGNENDDVKNRQQKFLEEYETLENKVGEFKSKEIIKAIQIKENIVFKASWGEMAVKAGGWITDQGYGIAEKSFINTYKKINQKTYDN